MHVHTCARTGSFGAASMQWAPSYVSTTGLLLEPAFSGCCADRRETLATMWWCVPGGQAGAAAGATVGLQRARSVCTHATGSDCCLRLSVRGGVKPGFECCQAGTRNYASYYLTRRQRKWGNEGTLGPHIIDHHTPSCMHAWITRSLGILGSHSHTEEEQQPRVYVSCILG